MIIATYDYCHAKVYISDAFLTRKSEIRTNKFIIRKDDVDEVGYREHRHRLETYRKETGREGS